MAEPGGDKARDADSGPSGAGDGRGRGACCLCQRDGGGRYPIGRVGTEEGGLCSRRAIQDAAGARGQGVSKLGR